MDCKDRRSKWASFPLWSLSSWFSSGRWKTFREIRAWGSCNNRWWKRKGQKSSCSSKRKKQSRSEWTWRIKSRGRGKAKITLIRSLEEEQKNLISLECFNRWLKVLSNCRKHLKRKPYWVFFKTEWNRRRRANFNQNLRDTLRWRCT